MAKMTNLFTDFKWSDREAQELHLVLTNMYPNERAATFVAEKVGIESIYLTLGVPVVYLWREIIEKAFGAQRLRELVSLARDQHAASAKRPFLDAILANEVAPVSAEPRAEDGTVRFSAGTSQIGEPEALLFREDLSLSIGRVPALIVTLEKMLTMAPSVCMLRVDAVLASGRVSTYGTGFHVGGGLLITNHHVLFPDGKDALSVEAHFGFEAGPTDSERPATRYACDLASIHADAPDDWGVIGVLGFPAEWPAIDLLDSADPVLGEAAFILQHPLAGRKRLGFVRNTITFMNDRVIHYLTDTQQGSSGAPVFDASGALVAVHHRGGTPEEVAGRSALVKNEGMRVSLIRAALSQRGLLG
jgi:S1-C subfamily serine protease